VNLLVYIGEDGGNLLVLAIGEDGESEEKKRKEKKKDNL
jgi:hypothetical protein